ncbi:MAG: AAA family ATPase [Anaerolineales bacterium]|nr:AAA family ATPase [Anaerolineales bacterium]
MAPERTPRKNSRATRELTSLTVKGFKSHLAGTTVRVRPLTILAGANSAGKSSFMHPFLMLKQTLEEGFDPGVLKIQGANVQYTDAIQFLSRSKNKKKRTQTFSIACGFQDGRTFEVGYTFDNKSTATIDSQRLLLADDRQIEFNSKLALEDLWSIIRGASVIRTAYSDAKVPLAAAIRVERCFLSANVTLRVPEGPVIESYSPATAEMSWIQQLIHLPGWRGNPERTYERAAVGSVFPGQFHNYTASLLQHWVENQSKDNLERVAQDLKELGLTWKIDVKAAGHTKLTIRVGRTPSALKSGALDLVELPDVGFGVSQVLPLVVALSAAQRGQLIYIEQPEIHLHPRAQIALGAVFQRAAARGVRLIIETHSALLLRSIQLRMARRELAPDQVSLNWFHRDDNGFTEVTSGKMDANGAWGDWPEDFGELDLGLDNEYLSLPFVE